MCDRVYVLDRTFLFKIFQHSQFADLLSVGGSVKHSVTRCCSLRAIVMNVTFFASADVASSLLKD